MGFKGLWEGFGIQTIIRLSAATLSNQFTDFRFQNSPNIDIDELKSMYRESYIDLAKTKNTKKLVRLLKQYWDKNANLQNSVLYINNNIVQT